MEYRSKKRQWIIGFVLVALSLSACATKLSPSSTVVQESIETPSTDHPAESPQPQRTIPPETIRPSILAGSWFPEDPEELMTMVDGFLDAVEPIDGSPIALIVPHAGYVYSGPIAAYGFKQLINGDYDTAVLIASDHQYPPSNPISIWAEGGFETPLGIVPVDTELSTAILDSDSRITFDVQAHDGEHPIEIELPFLQRVCPHCKIVPILMGDVDQENIQILAEALIEVLPGKRAVIIASSDLSHYPSYDDAHLVDGATLAAIETGDP
ncbi:MAG: AmmeMemoRadiSam system protein B, partial [Anaerolineaceae bacterium]